MTTHNPIDQSTATTQTPYQPRRQWQSQMLPVRNMHYHLRHWEPAQINPDLPVLVLAHGWMDVAASYQFVVDAFSEAFAQGRRIVAHDWRGFGLSRTAQPCDSYYFTDYLADLDMLLEQISPDRPVDLVGHSMGGNIAMMYAGVRPQRVRRLINLEGFGLPASRPAQAPGRLAQWLDEIKALHAGDKALKHYASADDVARRLMKTNPRLPADKALWLASHWAAPDALGQWHILGDAGHKVVNPQLYRVEEVLAVHQRITAPTLAVEASHNQMAQWWQGRFTLDEYHERLKAVPNLQIEVVNDAGHMLHHDQPLRVASLMQKFLA